MHFTRIALTTLASLIAFQSQANAQQIQPAGYKVQVLVWSIEPGAPSGNFWMTAATFNNYEDAADYRDFLFFLAWNDFDKLLDELDFDKHIFVHGFDYRIVPFYAYHHYYALPNTLLQR